MNCDSNCKTLYYSSNTKGYLIEISQQVNYLFIPWENGPTKSFTVQFHTSNRYSYLFGIFTVSAMVQRHIRLLWTLLWFHNSGWRSIHQLLPQHFCRNPRIPFRNGRYGLLGQKTNTRLLPDLARRGMHFGWTSGWKRTHGTSPG